MKLAKQKRNVKKTKFENNNNNELPPLHFGFNKGITLILFTIRL